MKSLVFQLKTAFEMYELDYAAFVVEIVKMPKYSEDLAECRSTANGFRDFLKLVKLTVTTEK